MMLLQSVVAFAPSHGTRSKSVRLSAVNDDLPDILKAYSKKAAVKAIDMPLKVDSPLSIAAPAPVVMDTPVPDVSVVDAGAVQFTFVDDFLKTAKEGYQARSALIVESPPTADQVPTLTDYVRRGFNSHPSVAHAGDIPVGKVKPLAVYVKDVVHGAPIYDGTHVVDAAANAKEKIALMASNTYSMLHLGSPSDMNMPNLPTDLPEGAAGWTVAAVAVIFAAGQRGSGASDAKQHFEEFAQKESLAVKELAEQVVSFRSRLVGPVSSLCPDLNSFALLLVHTATYAGGNQETEH
jgi:hypothetical protein